MEAVLGERMVRHGFAGRPCTSVADAAALTCAIQAQDHPAARLGVRARSTGLTDAGVQAAVTDRSVVRTWLMRGTIHLVAAADARWLLSIFGPAVARSFATRWRQLGLTADYLDRCVALLPEILADGPRTRAEVVAALAEAGSPLGSDDPQAGTHLLLHASCLGVVCRGPDRGRWATFTLLDDWLRGAPEGPRGDDALAELARRFFAAYSPATAADFATWAGIGVGRAVKLVGDELTPCDVYGVPGFRLGEVEPAGGVRLLPMFDNYLIGYKARAFVPAERKAEVYVGGIIRPAVLHDGEVTGRWSVTRLGAEAVAVDVVPFRPFGPRLTRAVEEEAADVGRFLGRDARVRYPD